MLQLRPYQQEILDRCRDQFRQGIKTVLLYAPTGGGKSEIAISLLNATAENNNSSAMILDRIVLCDQTSKRLEKYKIPHGVMQSGHWRYRPHEKIQICSAQTLEKRGSFPGIKLLIVDEAHCQRKETTEFIKNNPNIRTIGLSASPFTKGLGSVYQSVVSATTTKQLVDDGWLCPLKVFIAKEIDMAGAKKVAGEWSQNEATERGIKITGDIVAEWVKKTHELFGGPRKTIVFCAGVAHGEDLVKKFAEAGYNFLSISYKDDDDYKRDVIEDFGKSDTSIQGLIATDILTKGFDVSDVEILISARPFTKSFSSHVQQLGRGMRMFEGKKFCAVLDHSGNFLRFREEWEELYHNGVETLDSKEEKPKKEVEQKEKEAAKCPRCGALWGKEDVCRHCGYVRLRRNDVLEKPGEMVELGEAKKVEKFSSEMKESWYQQMLGFCEKYHKKPGLAFYIYKEKFHVEPAWKKQAAAPGAEVDAYCKSRLIAFSKGRKK